MNVAFVGIGSNLNNPISQVEWAVNQLALLPNTQLVKSSSLYKTQPVGDIVQQDFINAVVKLQTSLQPSELLVKLLALEQVRGRKRNEKWGPRTLDLDIILYGNKIIHTSTLVVPHPEMTKRRFVLEPLAEIEPHLILPCGTRVITLLTSVQADPLQTVDPLKCLLQE